MLSTARDIIFLWVARMVMMGLEFTGEVPFSDVYVHSIILAPDGRRMSKSLGTGIDPMDLITSHGADATRWGLLAMSSGQDVRFSVDKVTQGQQLANKLWNASRLILLRIDDSVRPAVNPARIEDRWILSRLERAKASVESRIDGFDFSHAALELYDFVYGELCDWYLELVKPRLYEGEPACTRTLLHVLLQTLALAHPMIPFVTEEIYGYIPGSTGLLAAGLPSADGFARDPQAEEALGRAIQAVQALRGWRDHAGVRAAARVPARLAAPGYEETAEHVGRLARIELSADGGHPVASVPVPGGVVEILATNEFDPATLERKQDAERGRLEAEIERSRAQAGQPGLRGPGPAPTWSRRSVTS